MESKNNHSSNADSSSINSETLKDDASIKTQREKIQKSQDVTVDEIINKDGTNDEKCKDFQSGEIRYNNSGTIDEKAIVIRGGKLVVYRNEPMINEKVNAIKNGHIPFNKNKTIDKKNAFDSIDPSNIKERSVRNNDIYLSRSSKSKEKERFNKRQRINKNKNNKTEKEFKVNKDMIYFICIFSMFVLYFVFQSMIPIQNEQNYLNKCPKHGVCDSIIEGNKTIMNLNYCNDNHLKLENGLIQICAPRNHSKFKKYINTLKAASYISKMNGKCFFQHKKIDINHIMDLFPKADVLLLQSDEDFHTVLINDEFRSLLPQYNPMCRLYKNSFEKMPFQTVLIIAILIISTIIASNKGN